MHGTMPAAAAFASQAFGLRWHSDWPNPWFAAAPDDGRVADVEIRRCTALPARPGGRRINNGEVFADGTRFSLDGAVIDMVDGRQIRWCAPGLSEVPLPLCSTVAAHVLAWRGMVPLHGSAVAFDGKAILIAGKSGAGKSTLAHALVERGGQLVSDDLSVLLPSRPGGVPSLMPGRPTIRLVAELGGNTVHPKRLAVAAQVDADVPVRLSMLLLLRRDAIGTGLAGTASDLIDQVFRPQWMQLLPNAKARVATLLDASARIGFATLPPASDAVGVAPTERAAAALALLHRLDAAR